MLYSGEIVRASDPFDPSILPQGLWLQQKMMQGSMTNSLIVSSILCQQTRSAFSLG